MPSEINKGQQREITIKATNSDFADASVILSEALESLVLEGGVLSSEEKPLGLEASWAKIEIQDFGGLWVNLLN